MSKLHHHGDPNHSCIDHFWIIFLHGQVIYVANVNEDPWEKDGNGDYITSNWQGELYYISSDLTSTRLLDTKEQEINTADIDYVIEDNLLLVPTFFDNRVIAFKIVR